MENEIPNQQQTSSSSPTNQPITSILSSNQLKKLIFILAAIFALLVVGAGAYYLGKSSETTTSQPEKNASNSEPTINTSPTTPAKQANALQDSFQTILTKYCKKIDIGPGAFFYGMQPENLPVLIDSSVAKIKPGEQGAVTCGLWPNSSYVYFEFDQNGVKNTANIYDKNSEELGHGGPPYLGSYGTVIKDDGNIKLTVYLVYGEGPALVGSTPVVMRGEKRLTLSNGETIYANYAKIAIKGKDSRLVSLLNNYSEPSDFEAGAREITGFPDQEIKNKFFNDLSNLQFPEKNALSEIQKVLSAISPK